MTHARTESPETPVSNETTAEPPRAEPKGDSQNTAEAVAPVSESAIVADLREKLARVQADYANLSKRLIKDQERFETRLLSNVARQILPVLDSLERAQAAPGATPEEFKKGLDGIQGQLFKILDEQGVKAIEAAGQAFDPSKHEAMTQVQNPSVPDQTVIHVLERGYALRSGEMVRTAKVVVARGGPERAIED